MLPAPRSLRGAAHRFFAHGPALWELRSLSFSC